MIERLLRDEEFWRRVNIRPSIRECWEWSGELSERGYGRYGRTLAHRYSFSLAHGGITPGAGILHSCDNPACVNPRHLREGTEQDNADDRRIARAMEILAAIGPGTDITAIRGMSVVGATAIRADFWRGVDTETLAVVYSVEKACIRSIVEREAFALADLAPGEPQQGDRDQLIYQRILAEQRPGRSAKAKLGWAKRKAARIPCFVGAD